MELPTRYRLVKLVSPSSGERSATRVLERLKEVSPFKVWSGARLVMEFLFRNSVVRFVAHSNPDKLVILRSSMCRSPNARRSTLVRSPLNLPAVRRMAASKLESGIETFVANSTVTLMRASALKPASSVTVKEIVVVPVWLGAGVTRRIQFSGSGLVATITFPLGTKLVFEELTVKTNCSLDAPLSRTRKANKAVAFAATDQFVRTSITGGSLWGRY